MIHTNEQIIKPETFQLLKKLQGDSKLNDFFLVGGTALALQLGHRYSIDLDLFTRDNFNEGELVTYLEEYYNFHTTQLVTNTILGFIDGVKVDFIAHKYDLVFPLLETEGVRMTRPLDIGAMKLNAISKSGQRQKDFYDMYFLLEYHSLGEIAAAYEKKYPQSSPMIALRALTYFNDIDFAIEPPVLVKGVVFSEVQERLFTAVRQANRIF